ncbi:Methyltransferase [Ceratobasidium theobromae]|uniref:Methyltransferase n=1 Tax=Ceratobasidium theobromae TaxID=1582974 RepID=A0A5N5QV43_9AGAM|nr:Methyltransferase [Ceratobasidium theobromae]
MGDVERLVALHLALQPVERALITDTLVDTNSQRNLIEQTIRNPHLTLYPPAPDYQHKFWKNVIAEIEDEIYVHLISTLSVPVRQGPPEASYLTYLLRRPESSPISADTWRRPPGVDNFSQDQRPLTILESRTTIERGTTGLRTWRASLDLAEWVLRNNLFSARILELGSGAGLLGLVIATIQQLARPNADANHLRETPCICMTDVDEDVLRRAIDGLNFSQDMVDGNPNVHVRALDWTDSLNPDRRVHVQSLLEEIDADVILAADVVYDLSIIPSLTSTLRLALERPLPKEQPWHRDASNNTRAQHRIAYVALTLRREQSFTEFLASAATEERQRLAVNIIDMNLPPHWNRVFRGSDDSASRGTDSTRLVCLTLKDAERRSE